MQEKIIRKIKACLALGASSNPNEAAAAMRQAKKLMEQHGIGESMLDVGKTEILAAYKTMPRWYTALAAATAHAFGCMAFHRGKSLSFVGPEGAPDIAAYSFDVVVKLSKLQRKIFSATTGGGAKAGNDFQFGFALGVNAAVEKFAAQISAEKREAYLGAVGPTKKQQHKKLKPTVAMSKGYMEGEKVTLHVPVARDSAPLMIGGAHA